MSIVHLVLVLIVAGLLLWVVNTYIPLASAVKKILNVVVVLVLVVWLLGAFGVLDSLSSVRIGKLR